MALCHTGKIGSGQADQIGTAIEAEGEGVACRIHAGQHASDGQVLAVSASEIRTDRPRREGFNERRDQRPWLIACVGEMRCDRLVYAGEAGAD